MRFLITLSILFSNSAAKACLFGGLSMEDLKSSQRFIVEEMEAVPFPREIIKAYIKNLGDFDDPSCKSSFVRERITDKKTGHNFAAYRSILDDCDGGNSYGAIVRGLEPKPQSVLATIEDSDIHCLK